MQEEKQVCLEAGASHSVDQFSCKAKPYPLFSMTRKKKNKRDVTGQEPKHSSLETPVMPLLAVK